MRLCEISLDGYLFEEGSMYIGNRCLIHVDGYYMIGTLHAYTSMEYCFKDCKYYLKPYDFVEWANHSFKPMHWISREDAMIWEKSTNLTK